MSETWWEKPVCWVCNFWWLLLLFLAGGLSAFFTRASWMPALPPTPTPAPTRVQSLGTGDVQATLIWNSTNDLDLWVTDPRGTLIYFNNRTSSSGGELDVDANPGCQNPTNQPVENIFWPAGKAPTGEYVISVNYFQGCETSLPTSFTLRVLVDGQEQTFSGALTTVGETQEIYHFRR